MLKPYFTQYLPVPGKIKPGEVGISTNNATYTHQEHLGEDYGVPARLFVCSRTIKVGERICVPDGDGVVGSWVASVDDVDTALRGFYNNRQYRIIAEVSPDAIWVTPDMQLREDEIDVWYYSMVEGDEGFAVPMRLEPGNRPPLNDEQLKTMNWKRVAMIKGPCGHFH